MNSNEDKLYQKKSDLTWPLCGKVGQGGTSATDEYPYRDSQSNALKGHKNPSGYFGNTKAQSHAGSSKSQSN